MKFQATEEQVKQIICNAINASIPVGLDHLHFEEREYKPEEIELQSVLKGKSGEYKPIISLDYHDGRMVKLSIKRLGDKEWEVIQPKYPPRIDYQSWVSTYSTIEALIASAT